MYTWFKNFNPRQIGKTLCFAAWWGVAMTVASSVLANNAFMPGDAFFHTLLTETLVEDFNAQKKVVDVGYAYPKFGGGFGGFAGFERLQVTEVEPAMFQSLKLIYDRLRLHHRKELRLDKNESGQEVYVETNGFHLFVYPRKTNWEKQRIGLKYNGSWMKLPQSSFEGSERGGFGKTRALS